MNFVYFKVLLTIVIMWAICGILTLTDVFRPGHPARTDLKLKIIDDAPWFRVPYPGIWITFAIIKYPLLYLIKK